jgi:hypothetical protein
MTVSARLPGTRLWLDLRVRGGEDYLTPDKGAKIVTDFQQADTNKDGKLSKADFQAASKSGLVQK